MIEENQYAHKASRALNIWLGPKGITDGFVCDKQIFCIATEALEEWLQVKEAGDSEDSDKGVDDGVVPASS
jgi:hypothetical protein